MTEPTNLHGPDDPAMEQLLTRALRAEADTVQPTDRIEQIRTEVRQQRRLTGRTVLGVVAAAVVLVVGGAVLSTVILQQTAPTANPGQPTGQPSAAPRSGASTGPSPDPSAGGGATGSDRPATPGSTAPTAAAVPVYWIGPDNKLFREFVSAADDGGPAATAVRQMLTANPTDPDYRRGPWASMPATAEITVTQQGQDLTVNLPAAAFAGSGSVTAAEATAAIQQLVWTVTAATQAQGSVTVLIDGKTGTAWGQVKLGSPMSRDANARSAVWIIDPTEGQAHTAGTVTVTGNSTAFEGTVQWRVTRPDGSVVAEGHTMGGANGSYADFRFSTELPAGTYLVTVFAPDMANDEGKAAAADTKAIVVR